MSVKLTIPIPVWLDRFFTWPLLIYRKLKFGYAYRRINLGQGLWTIVDPQDYYRFGNLNWCAAGQNGTFYALSGIKVSPQEIKLVRLHREIMKAPDGILIDHRNCYSLDNRKENLRPATRAQNLFNRPKRNLKKATSKFIGVGLDKSRGKWVARIYYQNKQIWLGRFDSEIDAAKAYDRAALEYHKDFAYLNFPRENYTNEIKPS